MCDFTAKFCYYALYFTILQRFVACSFVLSPIFCVVCFILMEKNEKPLID